MKCQSASTCPHREEFRVYCTFQSHEPEFDYLKSLEIEEKINALQWLRRSNPAHFLLTTNGSVALFAYLLSSAAVGLWQRWLPVKYRVPSSVKGFPGDLWQAFSLWAFTAWNCDTTTTNLMAVLARLYRTTIIHSLGAVLVGINPICLINFLHILCSTASSLCGFQIQQSCFTSSVQVFSGLSLRFTPCTFRAIIVAFY